MREFRKSGWTEPVETPTGTGYREAVLVVTADEKGNFLSARFEVNPLVSGAPDPGGEATQ